MYISPIELITTDLETEMDDKILTALQKMDIRVDEEELIKALKYDRDQYKKGFHDGEMSVMKQLYERFRINDIYKED